MKTEAFKKYKETNERIRENLISDLGFDENIIVEYDLHNPPSNLTIYVGNDVGKILFASDIKMYYRENGDCKLNYGTSGGFSIDDTAQVQRTLNASRVLLNWEYFAKKEFLK